MAKRMRKRKVGEQRLPLSLNLAPMEDEMDEGKRWLKAEDAATYVGVRVDQMRRLVRAGKVPAPSYSLGPSRHAGIGSHLMQCSKLSRLSRLT
jgi:hypothetical protein